MTSSQGTPPSLFGSRPGVDVANALPHASGCVDVPISVSVTGVVPPKKLIREIRRVLRPGGLFVHVGPLGYHAPDAIDHLTADDLLDEFRLQGFRVRTTLDPPNAPPAGRLHAGMPLPQPRFLRYLGSGRGGTSRRARLAGCAFHSVMAKLTLRCDAKRIAQASGLICILLSAPPAGAQTSPAASSQGCVGSLDVHVIDELVHEPLSGANVKLDGRLLGQTDARGHLAAEGLCQPRASLQVATEGYAPRQRWITVAPRGTVEVQLEPIFETAVFEVKPVEAPDTRATTVLTGEQLEAKRGQALSDVIADVPGVSQLRSGSGQAKPIVRGQFGRRLPIIVDGVRHRSQDWGIDHAPEIDPFVADRIAIVRGASGVRHGPDALGGALLIDPPAMPTRAGTRGELHVLGMSNGLGGAVMGRVQTQPAKVPGFSLQLEGGAKRQRAVTTPDYALDNTGIAEWSAGATASYRAGDHEYKLSYRHYDADLGVCTCFSMDSSSDFRAQLERQRPLGAELYEAKWGIARPYQAIAHDLVLGRARWSLPRLGKLTLSYAFQHDDRKEFDIVRSPTTTPQFAFRLWTHDVDAVVEHNPIHLSEHLHVSGSVGLVGMVQTHAYNGLPLVPDHDAAAVGVHASERLWGHDYEIEAGVRYDVLVREASLLRRDFLRLVRAGQLTETGCGPFDAQTNPVACRSTFHTVSGSLGGLWRPPSLAGWALKANLSTAARPPNPDEQYINGTAPSMPIFALGDPNIGPETTYGASVTASYTSERISGELSAFGNYVDDYIYFAPAIGADGNAIFDVIIRGAFPRFTTRAVDATFHGADGYVSASPWRWLTFDVQGALTRARNVSEDTYLVFVPPDRLRASVAFKHDGPPRGTGWAASIGSTYVRRQSRFDPAADLAPPPDAYVLGDATVAVNTRVAGRPLHIALQGTNLLGARYREYASLLRYFADQPGRQIMLRATVHFDSTDQP